MDKDSDNESGIEYDAFHAFARHLKNELNQLNEIKIFQQGTRFFSLTFLSDKKDFIILITMLLVLMKALFDVAP